MWGLDYFRKFQQTDSCSGQKIYLNLGNDGRRYEARMPGGDERSRKESGFGVCAVKVLVPPPAKG